MLAIFSSHFDTFDPLRVKISVKVIYGEWQEGKFMEENFWEKYLEKRRQEIEEEE